LVAGLDLLAQTCCFDARLLGAVLKPVDPALQRGLRRPHFYFYLIARRPCLG
jgi:hypothetical protein